MKKSLILKLCLFLLITGSSLLAQEITIIPNGIFEEGEEALVTGDYVRIRSGPDLNEKIITRVNRGTVIIIQKRGEKIVKINDMKNYWYNVKVKDSGVTGWIFGYYLNKKEKQNNKLKNAVEPESPTLPKNNKNDLTLRELGNISEIPSLIVTGDLNKNGISELIFLNKNGSKRYLRITGYEPEKEGFSQVYETKLQNNYMESLNIFEDSNLDFPLVSVRGNNFSYLYSYNQEKNLFQLINKIDSPLISLGMLNGQDPFLIYLKKNRIIDNDGTVTYYINAAKLKSTRGRLTMVDEKIQYNKPLPVQKLISFDLNGDRNAEVICEIGGKGYGGGIVILSFKDGTFMERINTGVNTYNDGSFKGIWGIEIEGKPKLVIYTTDPSVNNDVRTYFGFLYAALIKGDLTQEKFYPINKMLDDVNNDRQVVLYKNIKEKTSLSPFLIIDYNQEAGSYSVKQTIIQ